MTILDFIGDKYKQKRNEHPSTFSSSDLNSKEFRKEYGFYLLGEIRDSLLFYYDENEYDLFIKFFDFLEGKKQFSFAEYEVAFSGFSEYLGGLSNERADVMKTPEELLQFLFDQNILCYFEDAGDETFIRWCFRERQPTNISPKVGYGLRYQIHDGLANALNTGKRLGRRNSEKAKKHSGQIVSFDKEKSFGFVRSKSFPIDVFFHANESEGIADFSVGLRVVFDVRASMRERGKMEAYALTSV